MSSACLPADLQTHEAYVVEHLLVHSQGFHCECVIEQEGKGK